MRAPTQRLALEPRIVFDGALPIAGLDMPDFHPAVIEQTALAVAPVVQQQLSFRVPSQAEMAYVDNLARAVARSEQPETYCSSFVAT